MQTTVYHLAYRAHLGKWRHRLKSVLLMCSLSFRAYVFLTSGALRRGDDELGKLYTDSRTAEMN
jgi:hypothetical protein